MIKIWKECVIDYLTRLYGKPLGDLVTALMTPGALTPRPRSKGYILQEPGALVFEAHYLKTGLAKLYSIDERTGAEKIFYIWEEDSIIVMYKEFRESLPSDDYFIELIEDSELVSITNFCMEGIYEQHTVAHHLTNLILAEKKKRMMAQMNILLTPSKSNRFTLFEEKFPGLKGRLSNDEVCGFIGVSPSTLNNSKNED